MIDPVKILRRAWHILWNYRTLWVFGLIIALAAGSAGSSGNGGGNPPDQPNGNYQGPANFQEAIQEMRDGFNQLFTQGIPEINASPEEVVSFLWVIGTFILVMFLVGIVVTVAYYVSVTSTIRMVDEYENSGTKLTVREGFRAGWSRTSWRVFLINLVVNLPAILFFLTLLGLGIAIVVAALNQNMALTPILVIVMIGLLFLGGFVVAILSIALHALRPFFWRVCVLEGAGVRESLQRGFAMVRESWRSAGLMWLVMIGLGLAWLIASIFVFLLTLPILLITGVLAAIVAAIPGLVLVGIFSLFLNGWLPWVAAGIFILPLFALIAFSPWVVIGGWQKVYTSTVWTLTYREIKALPLLAIPSDLQPVGD